MLSLGYSTSPLFLQSQMVELYMIWN